MDVSTKHIFIFYNEENCWRQEKEFNIAAIFVPRITKKSKYINWGSFGPKTHTFWSIPIRYVFFWANNVWSSHLKRNIEFKWQQRSNWNCSYRKSDECLKHRYRNCWKCYGYVSLESRIENQFLIIALKIPDRKSVV